MMVVGAPITRDPMLVLDGSRATHDARHDCDNVPLLVRWATRCFESLQCALAHATIAHLIPTSPAKADRCGRRWASLVGTLEPAS